MAKVVPLFSGSNGNSYYVGSSGTGVLIDAGRSCKQIENAMSANGLDMRSVEAIFVTHEHSDHCTALRVLASRYGLKVYASAGTLEGLRRANRIDGKIQTEVISDEIVLSQMLIRRVNTSHDAMESCGYQITAADGKKAVIATDTGFITPDVFTAVCESDFAVIESNHDIDMLKSGGYPYFLKQRILSDKGHLSNGVCAETLPEFVKNGTLHLMLGHLSRENNTPRLAYQTAVKSLEASGMKDGRDFKLYIAPEETNGKAVIF